MSHHFDLGLGLAWYLVFVASTVFHEAAHALAAWKLGDSTSYRGGQVSLNPAPHIQREPFGMVVMPILSFIASGWMIGWASTPYDPLWATQYPRRSALMALAGPVANLCLLILAAVAIRIGVAMGVFYAPGEITAGLVTAATTAGVGHVLATVVSILFTLNLLLFFFNLLPLPPLDGSGILPLVMDRETAIRYQDMIRHPTFSIIGLLIAWKLFGFIFHPIHLAALNLLYPGSQYQ